MKIVKIILVPKDPELEDDKDEDNFPSNQNGAYKLKNILKNPADAHPYPTDKVQYPNNDQNPYLTTDLPSSDTKDQLSYPTTDFAMRNFNIGKNDDKAETTLTSKGWNMGIVGG